MYEERITLEVEKHILFDATHPFKCVIPEKKKQD